MTDDERIFIAAGINKSLADREINFRDGLGILAMAMQLSVMDMDRAYAKLVMGEQPPEDGEEAEVY